MNASEGASAAADKAALKLVAEKGGAVAQSDPEDQEEGAGDITGALAQLGPEELSRKILSLILDELENDKAEDIVTIPLDGKSDIADYMVVASGRSQRHVSAMADKILRRLKDAGYGRAQIEGANAADWVLIDAGDVIVHIFRPEVRAFYNLERVWSETAHAQAGTQAGTQARTQARTQAKTDA